MGDARLDALPARLASLLESGEAIGSLAEQLGETATEQVGLIGAAPRQLREIAAVSQQNVAAAQQAKQGADRLAARGSESKAALDELGTLVAEMCQAVAANTEIGQVINAFGGEVSKLVAAAGREAEKIDASARGFAVVAEAVRQLAARCKGAVRTLRGELAASAGATGDTQKLLAELEEVAFETNMLALNAAVEGAHVSAAGAGFSRMTDELRVLATNADAAAQKSEELVQRSVALAEQTKVKALAVDEAQGEMGLAVNELCRRADEIAQSCVAQAGEVEQLQTGLQSINRLTNVTAGSAEEMYLAADTMLEELRALQLDLDEAVPSGSSES
ncbi:MAG: hypothetical protein KC619_33990 [Myxococcales bacterium]|nr:hypothetical protein [Myxococcales bacterium]